MLFILSAEALGTIFYSQLKVMKRDNLELLNFTKSQIFEKQRYNIVENIILYNMKHLNLFEIWNAKNQLAKQMTFWSI